MNDSFEDYLEAVTSPSAAGQESAIVSIESQAIPGAKAIFPSGGRANFFAYGAYTIGDNEDIPYAKVGAALAAISNHAVYACANKLAEDAGSVPYRMIDNRTDKTICTSNDYDADREPVIRALRRYQENNDGVSLFYMWELHKEITGEAYIQLLRNDWRTAEQPEGYPADLELLNSLLTDPYAPSNRIQSFQYTGWGSFITVPPDQMVYDRYRSNILSDVRGYSPVLTAIGGGSINVMKAAARAALSYFQNDGLPYGLVTPNLQATVQEWKDNEQNTIARALERNKGAGSKYKAQVFPYPIDMQIFDLPDLQKWAELLRSIEPQVYTAYRTPRSVVGDSDSTRYQASQDDVPNYNRLIAAKLRSIAAVVNTRIVPFFYGHRPTARFEFDLSQFEVVSEVTARIASQAYRDGVIDLNEYRRSAGYELKEKGELHAVAPGATVTTFPQLVASAAPPVPINPAPTTAPLNAGSTQVQLGTEPDKSIGEKFFVSFQIGSQSDLLGLQRQVQQMCQEPGCEWNNTSDFHVTLLYAEAATEESVRAFLDQCQKLTAPAMLEIGSLAYFQNLSTNNKYAVHFQVKRKAPLLEYQETLHTLATDAGILCSQYSHPDYPWKPHVTMGYTPSPLKQTFDPKLKIQPQGIKVMLGEKALWQSWGGEEDTADPAQEALKSTAKASSQQSPQDELLAWRAAALRRGAVKTALKFEAHILPEDVSSCIRGDLLNAESPDAIKSVFSHWQRVLDARDGVSDYDQRSFDSLPESTQTYIKTLRELHIVPEQVMSAGRLHYTGVLAAKALSTTRSQFEAEFKNELDVARHKEVTPRRYTNILNAMADRFGGMTLEDGLTDGGIDLGEFDPDLKQQIMAPALAKARTYIQQFVASLFADGLTDAQAAGKAGQWWTGAILPFYYIGLDQAAKSPMVRWQMDRGKENCRSCLTLDGQVHQLSAFQKFGFIPGSGSLICGPGKQCGCKLVPAPGAKASGRLAAVPYVRGRKGLDQDDIDDDEHDHEADHAQTAAILA